MVYQTYQLQCYTPEKYTIVSGRDNRCIAPTAKSIRCPWRITGDDMRECLALEAKARNLVEGDERFDVLCDLVLLRCCEQATHREKLTYDDSGCLYQVAEAFAERIPARVPTKVEVKEDPYTTQQSLLPIQSTASSSTVTKSRVELDLPKYELKSRGPSLTANGDIFIPYVTDPKDTVKGDLLRDVPWNQTDNGMVYAFIWPSNPEYTKVGYTGYSSEARVRDWQSCHPGATLRVSTVFDFPERMERLIHLQMAKQRHKIMKCTNCMKTHFEWFKVPVEEVRLLIQDWKKVVEREPLYGPGRALTKAWRDRIQPMNNNEITARALLELLDAEEKLKQEIREKVAIQLQASDELKSALKVMIEAASLPTPTTPVQGDKKQTVLPPTILQEDKTPVVPALVPSSPECKISKPLPNPFTNSESKVSKSLSSPFTNSESKVSQPLLNPFTTPEKSLPNPFATPEKAAPLSPLPSVPSKSPITLQADKEKEPPVTTVTTPQKSPALPPLPSVSFTFTPVSQTSKEEKDITTPVTTLKDGLPLSPPPSIPFKLTQILEAGKEDRLSKIPTFSFSSSFTSPGPKEATPLSPPPSVPSKLTEILQTGKEDNLSKVPTFSFSSSISSPGLEKTTALSPPPSVPSKLTQILQASREGKESSILPPVFNFSSTTTEPKGTPVLQKPLPLFSSVAIPASNQQDQISKSAVPSSTGTRPLLETASIPHIPFPTRINIPSVPFTFTNILPPTKDKEPTTPTRSTSRIFSSPSTTTTDKETVAAPTPLRSLPSVPTHTPTSSREKVSDTLEEEASELPLKLPSVPSHSPGSIVSKEFQETEKQAIPIRIPIPILSSSSNTTTTTTTTTKPKPNPAPPTASPFDNDDDPDTILTRFSEFMQMLSAAIQSPEPTTTSTIEAPTSSNETEPDKQAIAAATLAALTETIAPSSDPLLAKSPPPAATLVQENKANPTPVAA